MLAGMHVSANSNELAPDEVVSATYLPSKRLLIVTALGGAAFGLVLGLGWIAFSEPGTDDLILAMIGPVVGAILALMNSIRTASLKFGTDWVEGPREGGTGTILIRRQNAARLEIIDPQRIRLHRSDMERLAVNLGHYDFMDAQMIRMRLTAIAGGPTSTPPEMLISDSRQKRKRSGSQRSRRRRRARGGQPE